MEKYILDKKYIGKGSFSKVYKAVEKETNKVYAIKKMQFSTFSDALKKRIHNELFILQSVTHENIVNFFDFYYQGDFLYIVFEYCENTITSFDSKHMKEIFYQIVQGIYYLHTKNILHRDIKPDNILVKDGIPKICDFGFSAIIKNEMDMNNTICGTPLYMSPETLFFKPYTKKSDVWSLGILFYVLSHRHHPYGELSSIEEYRNKIKSYQVKYDKTKTKSFLHLLSNMLRVNEQDRYSIYDVYNHPYFVGKQPIIDDYFSSPENQIIIIEKQRLHSSQTSSLKNILYSSLEILKKGVSKFSL
jgi:serine/threonine protein kinase